ncbi:MAG: FliM/FliN family flagellar motor switch protein [Planctomycetota bacterium]
MSELTPEIAADVRAACEAGAGEAAEALARALDIAGEPTLTPGETAVYAADSPPDGAAGAGLLIKLVVGEHAVVGLLPAASGMTPDWCATPDATGESKLATLAQELGMLLLPETLIADDFAAGWSADLAAAAAAGGVADGAATLPLTITADDKQGVLTLVWPATDPAALLAASGDEEADSNAVADAGGPEGEAAEPADGQTPAAETPPPRPRVRRVVRDFGDLPSYARSLLSIEVPVMVTLAEKREDVATIVDLGPGSIITFDKACDGPLGVEVCGRPVATGEAVKVGEKFGVRIAEMILPGEQFLAVRPDQRSA